MGPRWGNGASVPFRYPLAHVRAMKLAVHKLLVTHDIFAQCFWRCDMSQGCSQGFLPRMPIIRTQDLSSSLCVTEELQNHWILVSEKPIYKTDIPIKSICQKKIPKRGVHSQKPFLGNKFHWQLGQSQKDLVLQLPQSTANLCKNQLSCNLCNLHDKNVRTGSLQSSILIISIGHKNNLQSTGLSFPISYISINPNCWIRSLSYNSQTQKF